MSKETPVFFVDGIKLNVDFTPRYGKSVGKRMEGIYLFSSFYLDA